MKTKTIITISIVISFLIYLAFSLYFSNYARKNIYFVKEIPMTDDLDEYYANPKDHGHYTLPMENSFYKTQKGFIFIDNKPYYKFDYFFNKYCLIEPVPYNIWIYDENLKYFTFENIFKNSLSSVICEGTFRDYILSGYPFAIGFIYSFFIILFFLSKVFNWKNIYKLSKYTLIINTVIILTIIFITFIIFKGLENAPIG